MIGGLAKILDRSVVIGYALPALAILLAGMGVGYLFGFAPAGLIDFREPLKDGTTFAALTILLATCLMVANLGVYRFMEGYRWGWLGRAYRWFGASDCFGWLEPERRKFRRLASEFADVDAHVDTMNDPKLETRWRVLKEALVSRFPREHLLLPTAFGNTIRAAEDYARQMYGIAGVMWWVRLAAVIPKD